MGRTRCNVTSGTISLSAGVSDYANAVTAMEILNVFTTSSSQKYPLTHVDTQTLLDMRNSTFQSSPIRWYAYNGFDLFMIYPTPALADTVTLYYVPYPTALSASSDSPVDIPAEYHPAVEYYAFYRAATFSDDTSSQMGQQYLQQYELWIRRLKKRIALAGGRKLPRARITDGREWPFHDRSTYPGGAF